MVYSRRHPFISAIFFMVILVFILLATSTIHSADVILMWDRPPDDARVSGYKIFYGLADTDFKIFPNKIIHSPDQTSCNISNLRPGNTYGFAAKSMDKEGNESIFSEVIYYDVPVVPPNDSQNDHDDGEDDKRCGGSGGCFIHVVSEYIDGLIGESTP